MLQWQAHKRYKLVHEFLHIRCLYHLFQPVIYVSTWIELLRLAILNLFASAYKIRSTCFSDGKNERGRERGRACDLAILVLAYLRLLQNSVHFKSADIKSDAIDLRT